jgi:acyl-[acyl-carrier-protein]-phospholipid O-acyltransferase/long-chain-fatty-acid--[acyl-carrier-protein] ligase
MATGSYSALLATPNYRSLLIAQFSGALNDNLYRMVASLFAVTLAGAGKGSGYVALAGVLFIAPFLTLSGLAGRLADTIGKRPLLVAAKAAELAVMALAMLAFFLRSIELVLVALLLMATQSTFFSPARYGILPDLVRRRDLSRANGLGEMSMFSAILIGSGLGGALFELWRDHLYLTALPMIAIAAIGLLASFNVRPPATERRSAERSSGIGIAAGLRMLRDAPALGMVVLAVSLFWGLGAMAQFDILFYGKNVLALGETAIGLLQATLGLGIGAGCVVAGWLSGDRVHLGLAQIGMVGVAVAFIPLGVLPAHLITAFAGIAVGGFAGGLFVVPMISFMHQRSAEHSRGQLFATNNFLNMFGVLLGIGLAFTLHDLVGMSPAGLFVAIGVIALAAAAASLSSQCVLWVAHPGVLADEPPLRCAGPD